MHPSVVSKSLGWSTEGRRLPSVDARTLATPVVLAPKKLLHLLFHRRLQDQHRRLARELAHRVLRRRLRQGLLNSSRIRSLGGTLFMALGSFLPPRRVRLVKVTQPFFLFTPSLGRHRLGLPFRRHSAVDHVSGHRFLRFSGGAIRRLPLSKRVQHSEIVGNWLDSADVVHAYRLEGLFACRDDRRCTPVCAS